MPNASLNICSYPGCAALVNRGRCNRHKKQPMDKERHKRYNTMRPRSDSFYGTAAWKNARQSFRLEHPLCCECERMGLIRPMNVVDHIIPLKLRPDLALDPANLRSLCSRHHALIGEKVSQGGAG